MEARGTMKFLVTDYDKCAFTTRGTHPQLLSAALARYALMSDYAGFYGCTHRSYAILPILLKHATDKADQTNYDEGTITSMFPTYAITENFQHETNLACLGVSTVDDLLGKKCGESYETIIKPFEKSSVRPSPDMRYVKLDDYNKYTKSKNQQLAQVAMHAAERYPKVKITLDYMDDNVSLCRKALEATKQSDWPHSVSLDVYHHDATDDDAPIVQVRADKHVNYKPRIAAAKPAATVSAGAGAVPASSSAPAAAKSSAPTSAPQKRSIGAAIRAVGVFAATGGMSTYGTPRPSADAGSRETRSGQKY